MKVHVVITHDGDLTGVYSCPIRAREAACISHNYIDEAFNSTIEEVEVDES